MTVFEVVVVANPGGTSSEWSIARDRARRGDLRRRESGCQRRLGVGRDAGVAPGVGGADQSHGSAEGPGGWRVAGLQGADVGAHDHRGWFAHRPRRHAARGGNPVGVGVPGDGTLDVGHVPARVHVRACPPARPGDRRDDPPRVGDRCRPRRRSAGDRRRLDNHRSRRQTQAGCWLRLHETVRVSPDPRDPSRHRRGPPRPDAQRRREHPARRETVRGRAHRPSETRGRHGRDRVPVRLGILVG
jgi:hypothetical protein